MVDSPLLPSYTRLCLLRATRLRVDNTLVSSQCVSPAECLLFCAQSTGHSLHASGLVHCVFVPLSIIACSSVARIVCALIIDRGCISVEIPILVRFGHDRESNFFHMASHVSTMISPIGPGQHFFAEDAAFGTVPLEFSPAGVSAFVETQLMV